MANRYGRRSRTRNWPDASSSSGTPTPDLESSPKSGAEILELRPPTPEIDWRDSYGPVTITNEDLERGWWARKNLETMGFVFPAPGEAFGELGGLGPPPDPLEERIRKELGL